MYEFPSTPPVPKPEAFERELPRAERLGDIDPRTLTREQFEELASLFHAARTAEFRVEADFDYSSDAVHDATLGGGLYTTTDKSLAEAYARNRPGGTLHTLMPYQATLLDLTPEKEVRNLSVPLEIVREWSAFARPQIVAQIRDPEVNAYVQDRLIAVYDRLLELGKLSDDDESFIDLRKDILGTRNTASTVVDALWKEFCAQKGYDGVIFVEGGDSEETTKNDRTYVFYSPSHIGTWEDWQART